MAVVYGNVQGSGTNFSSTSVETGSITIPSTADRCVKISFLRDTAVSSITSSCGGVSGTAITGASGSSGSITVSDYQVIAPAAGATTASLSWVTAASFCAIAAVLATGVDQTTGMNNGTFASGAEPKTINVTSASGDLTCTSCYSDLGSSSQTSDRDDRVTGQILCMDTGPGTANPGHTWSDQFGATQVITGANFVQVSAGGGGIPHKLMTLGVGF